MTLVASVLIGIEQKHQRLQMTRLIILQCSWDDKTNRINNQFDRKLCRTSESIDVMHAHRYGVVARSKKDSSAKKTIRGCSRGWTHEPRGSLGGQDQWVRRGARNFMGFHNNERIVWYRTGGIGEVERTMGEVVLLKVARLIASNIW